MLVEKIKIKILIPFLVFGLVITFMGGFLNLSTSLSRYGVSVAKAATINSISSRASWVGNSDKGTRVGVSLTTWGGSYNTNVNPGVQDIHVRPDGFIDLIQRSDEGYQFGSIFDTNGIKKHVYLTFNDDDGGESISGNSQYTFMARKVSAVDAGEAGSYPAGALPLMNNSPLVGNANGWFGVERFSNDVNSPVHVPFSGGVGKKGNFLKLYDDQNPTFNRNIDIPYPQISGMVATNSVLYISDYLANKVLKYDPNTMTKIGEFAVNKPGKITIDKDGYLWIIGETNFRREKYYTKNQTIPTKIVKYDTNGNKQSQEIFNTELVAGDIAVDSQNRLVVGDGGVKSQVIYYSNLNSTPTISKTVGELGGIFGGVKGQYGDYKLTSITGIGVDAQDNLIVGMNDYGIAKFNAAGVFQWFKHGTNWKGPGIIDPKNPKILYSSDYKYEVDWSKPRDQWKLLAKIYDNRTFPNDYKNDQYNTGEFTTPLMNGIKACYINNQLFTVGSENNDTTIGFHKFVPGQFDELAVPAGYFYIGRPRAKINPVKNAWEEGWFWESQWNVLPLNERALRWWSDNNNNYTRDLGETAMMSEADYTRLDNSMTYGWAREFDDDCGLWAATKDNVVYLAASGLNASGNPVYNFANAQKFNIPSDFPKSNTTGLERFWYDKNTDSAYITGYTAANPRPTTQDVYGWNGTSVARYDNWKSGNPTKAWQQDIPFIFVNNGNYAAASTTYSTFSQVGDLIFMSRNQEGDNGRPFGFIRVLRASDGVFLGNLEVPADDQPNRPDGSKSMSAVKNPDGTYTVSQIDVTRSKIRLWQVIPDTVPTITNNISYICAGDSAGTASGSAPVNTTTTCAFVLPSNQTLATDFKLSIGNGAINQTTGAAQSCSIGSLPAPNTVTCSNVPTGNSVGNMPIFGNLGAGTTAIKTATGQFVNITGINMAKANWNFTPDQGNSSPLFKSTGSTSVNIRNFKTNFDFSPNSNTRYTCALDYRALTSRSIAAPNWNPLPMTQTPYNTTTGCTFNLTKAQRNNNLNLSLRLTITDTTNTAPSTTNPNTFTLYNEYIYRFLGAGVASGE